MDPRRAALRLVWTAIAGAATASVMAIDVSQLPEAAEQLGDLTEREREVLDLLSAGLTSRDIADQLALSEATVYLVIADLLDALEYEAPRTSMEEVHRRAGTRPATPEEITEFFARFGPFETDAEG